jgi:hypothetical protein
MTSSTSRNQKSSAAAAADPTLDEAPDKTVEDSTEAASAPAAADAPAVKDVAVEPAADSTAPGVAADPEAPAEERDPRKVKVVLAHPIDKPDDLRRLGLAEKEGGYKPHDEIWVFRSLAQMLITAGYAQVDPEDKKAVEAALTPSA